VLTRLGRLFANTALLFPALALAGGKVLYVTHEPGRWHDYSQQREVFVAIADEAGWDLTVASGDKEAMENLINQARDGGVPALLLRNGVNFLIGGQKSPGSALKS